MNSQIMKWELGYELAKTRIAVGKLTSSNIELIARGQLFLIVVGLDTD